MSLQSTVDRIEDFVSGSVTGGSPLVGVVISSCDSFYHRSVRCGENPVGVVGMAHGKTANTEYPVWKGQVQRNVPYNVPNWT